MFALAVCKLFTPNLMNESPCNIKQRKNYQFTSSLPTMIASANFPTANYLIAFTNLTNQPFICSSARVPIRFQLKFCRMFRASSLMMLNIFQHRTIMDCGAIFARNSFCFSRYHSLSLSSSFKRINEA